MALPIDACNWDEARLIQEIASRLPKGWSYKVQQAENDFWVVTLFNVHKEPVWREADAVAQLALLTTVGWLEVQLHKNNRASPWAPRQGDFKTGAHEEAYRKLRVEEDPPDLDPKEIAAVVASVYSRTRR